MDLGRNQEGFGELEATSGDDVIALQMCLQRLGYFTNEIDGKFAGQTVKALKKYQASIGVQEVGFASIELQKQLYAQVNSADNFDPSLYTPAQLLEIVSIINNYLP